MKRSITVSMNERWSRRSQAVFAGLLIFLAVSPSPADTQTPDFYIRKSSWHASLLASLEALAARGLEDVFESFESATMCGGDHCAVCPHPAERRHGALSVCDWCARCALGSGRLGRCPDRPGRRVRRMGFTIHTCQRLVRPLRKGHHAQERPLPEVETLRPHVRARVECAGGQYHPCAFGGRVGMVRGQHRRGRLGRQQRHGAFQCAGRAHAPRLDSSGCR